MECALGWRFPAGDHDVVIACVTSVALSDGYPIVYWRRGLHALRPQYDFLKSSENFEKFLAAWECGALPKSLWTHAAHVAVGAYYAVLYSDSAFERTRAGILRYNKTKGTENSSTSGYHETLTRFWANLLAEFVTGIADPWEAAVQAVNKFGEERDLHHLYYTFDVIRSTDARRMWIPPDMEPERNGNNKRVDAVKAWPERHRSTA
jgi:hypothetical protein